MQTDPPGEDPQAQRLHRMESSIEALNARIARLAIALDVSLKSDAEVAHVMNRRLVSAVSHGSQTTSDHHMAYKWEELRGLLVLRYGVETRYVDQVGVIATRQILIEAEAHLMREGFNPGDDGIDLDRLFNES
jgi:hypothetical protein